MGASVQTWVMNCDTRGFLPGQYSDIDPLRGRCEDDTHACTIAQTKSSAVIPCVSRSMVPFRISTYVIVSLKLFSDILSYLQALGQKPLVMCTFF